MKLSLLTAILSIYISISSVKSQSLLDQLVTQNSTHPSVTKWNVTSILALASPFKPVTDLLSGSRTITAFIPTDEAIAAAVKSLGAAPSGDALLNILTYHVVPDISFDPTGLPDSTIPVKTLLSAPSLGSNATQFLIVKLKSGEVTVSFGLESAKVIGSVKGENGIIHYIDALLLPPKKVSETAKAAKLNKLVEAIVATNLTNTVDTAKNVTIFAPTDAAFDAISSITKTLSVAQISGVLQYHVVPGALFSPTVATLTNNTEVDTVLGQKFKIIFTKDGVTLFGTGNKDAVKLVTTDVLVENGVVHVIDAVLIPDVAKVPNPSPTASSTAAGSSTSASFQEKPFLKVILALTAVMLSICFTM